MATTFKYRGGYSPYTQEVTEGGRVNIHHRPGMKLVQDRPFECRHGCKCGTCDGVLTEYPGTVDRIIYYADNSIVAYVDCDDGERRHIDLKASSGDPC